ncbi:Cobalamin biosynthesis protein CobD [Ruminococcaceae bacterium BL-6]|nr:Cobalamin biosynthesis protein CobD [Ruminococcaceae bacterium BL-6]
MLNSLLAVAAGFFLDLLLGDPENLWHPVRAIGWLISRSEAVLRRLLPKTPRGELAAGVVLAVFVPAVCFAVPFFLLRLLGAVHPLLSFAAESILCWQALAIKSMKTESMRVCRALTGKDLPGARRAVSRIVGRDTAALDEAGVIRAAVETVAENTSDGVIAPLLFLFCGGAPLGFLYKAVNTMDSMVGYRNERYLYFGRAAARLDDAANFIPARVSALLMIAAAFLLRYDGKNAARIFRRDRYRHFSPNSAQTESVCAGALGLRLGGDSFYFGRLCHKPTLGDALRPPGPEDIVRANRLLYASAGLCFALGFLVKAALIFW